MNILLLTAVLFPIAVLALLRRVPVTTLRGLVVAAMFPMIAIALERYFHWSQRGTLSDGRLISILIILFSAGFVYGWLRPAASFSPRPPALLLLVVFIVLLLPDIRSPPALVLLANLPALLVHRLSPHSSDDESPRHVLRVRRFFHRSSGLVAPTSFLAALSVVAAIFLPTSTERSLSLPGSTALGIVVAALIWQILLLLGSGGPVSGKDGVKKAGPSADATWLLQRQIRVASVLALCLTLFYLRWYIQLSLFALSIIMILSASALVVTGSLMLMERTVLHILSLMEYFWITVLLAGFCLPVGHSGVILGTVLITVAIEMAADCSICTLLTGSVGTHLDLDSITGWRFSRPWASVWLGLLVLMMQFLPGMPAFHFLIPILSALIRIHPCIAILIFAVNGAMVIAAFRLLVGMYSKPDKLKI